MITWHRALSEGASGLFDCGGKKVFEIAEEQVRELHAIIGELAVANDFLHGISNRVPASEAGHDWNMQSRVVALAVVLLLPAQELDGDEPDADGSDQ